MHPLFQDIPVFECFIDDIGIFTNSSFDHHLSIVQQALYSLEENVFTVNPLKCAWAVQSTDYLGFLLTIYGIKPFPQKLRQLAAFNALQHLRTFIPTWEISTTIRYVAKTSPYPSSFNQTLWIQTQVYLD